jgi:hypothetical protein
VTNFGNRGELRLLQWAVTLDAGVHYRRLDSVASSAFHHQSAPTFLTVVSEERLLSTFGTFDPQGKAAHAAADPAGLYGGSASGTPRLEGVNLAAAGTGGRVRWDELVTVLAGFPVA